jgi:iron(III) transport system substrate-binding protein
VVAVLVALVVAWQLVWRRGGPPLVVYCAHDSVYSEQVLRDFEAKVGIRVAPKFDTEATKSLGLVEQLKREKANPRCDVFWNNELLGTLDLKNEGVLEPYKGDGYARIPEAFRDADGCWAGFGARMRVYIINTDRMQATEQAVADMLADDLGDVAIAKPLYGTTLTHYSVLWGRRGEEGLKGWHADCRRRNIVETGGNAQVKDLVAGGTCALGYTDTDDYFVARDEGKPVDALPVRLEDGAVICIPNTVSIVRGTTRLADAQRLVDYLLSAECELELANARSRQVPLGPVDEERVPEEVRTLREWAKDGVPLTALGPARDACLAWLKEEYVQ